MRRGGAPSAGVVLNRNSGVVLNRNSGVVLNRNSGVVLTRGRRVALKMTGLSVFSAASLAPPFRQPP